MVSSEHSLQHGSEQWRWLVGHLAGVDRCKTPWLLVAIHRPLYVVKPHHVNRKVAKHLRKQLEDVLVKYGVDAVLSGHVHSFSRTCAVVDRDCTPHAEGGVLHVVAGSGGHKLSQISAQQHAWVDAAERAFGYLRVKVRARLCMRAPCVACACQPSHALRFVLCGREPAVTFPPHAVGWQRGGAAVRACFSITSTRVSTLHLCLL